MNAGNAKRNFGAFGIVGWLFSYFLTSFREAAQDFCYLVAWWRATLGRVRAEEQLVSAQFTLGEQLGRSGLGDETLRHQLAVIDDRIRSVKVAQGASKELEAERRGLLIRLAESYRISTDVSGEVGTHTESRNQAMLALDQRRGEVTQARQLLLPNGHLRLNSRCWSFGLICALATACYTVPEIMSAVQQSDQQLDQWLQSEKYYAKVAKHYEQRGDSVPSREDVKRIVATPEYREEYRKLLRENLRAYSPYLLIFILLPLYLLAGGVGGAVFGLLTCFYVRWSRTVPPAS